MDTVITQLSVKYIKLLIFSSALSGKSTFLTQLELLSNSITKADLQKPENLQKVLTTATLALATILSFLERDKLLSAYLANDSELLSLATKLMGDKSYIIDVAPEFYPLIKFCFQSKEFARFNNKNKYKFVYSHLFDYFAQNIENLDPKNTRITFEDLLRKRLKTSGIHHTNLNYNNCDLYVCDGM